MTQKHSDSKRRSFLHLPPHVPFAPSKSPIFYGWIILLVGAFGVVMSAPGQTVGVSAFTDFLIRDLGISQNSLSLAYLIGTLVSSFILSYAGIVYDRYGARMMGTIVAVALSGALLSLSLIPEIIHALHTLFSSLPLGPSTFVLLCLGFFMLRFFGQGALTLVSRNMVLKWFEQRRGFANALVGAATTLGFSASPLVFNTMIEHWGWQASWRMTGIIVGLPFAVIFLLLARDNPHECGLLPDGGVTPKQRSNAPEARASAEFTLRQAQRTLPFWVFLGVITLASMYFTGLTFNIVSVFEEAGRTREQAISIFLPASIIALALNLTGGWICDRIRFKYLVMLQGLGMLISTIAVLFLKNAGMVPLLIIGNGINSGMFGLVMAVPWPRFFGLTHLGRISGFVAGWSVAGSALGPYAFSLCLTFFGSYAGISILTALNVAGFLIFSPFANRPEAP